MAKPRVAAIIQARMGSTRLPGKVLASLAGEPVLWHVVHRLRKCRKVDIVALATSTNPADDPLVEFAGAQGLLVVRGPEDDVLARFILAAREADVDFVLRVTGDAPLIDPELIDRKVDALLASNGDYCIANPSVRTIHEGFSLFTRAALERLSREAGHDPVAREHVDAYFKLHPEWFPTIYVPVPPSQFFEGARVSVDTPADLRFLNEVYRRLGSPPGDAHIDAVVDLLTREPELLDLNRHVHQKSAEERTRRIIIRCDGDSSIGMGHVTRCLSLAEVLRHIHGFGVTFAMAKGAPGQARVENSGFSVDVKPLSASEESWMDAVLLKCRADCLVLDVRTELDPIAVRQWRKTGTVIVTIDDPSSRRLECDFAFYPPVPQVERLEWAGFGGELFVGWEWVILGSEPCETRKRDVNMVSTVLVTMGGSDPLGLTMTALEALDRIPDSFHTKVVVGPGFTRTADLNRALSSSQRPIEVIRDLPSIGPLLTEVDLAIATFGVTAYELAAAGIPSILLGTTPDHIESGSIFAKEEVATVIGSDDVRIMERIEEATSALMNNCLRRDTMGRKAAKLVDGRGATRIAGKLSEALTKSRRGDKNHAQMGNG